ncbi:MAG: acetyl-CoA C-acyltransferase [Actinobacteria bacterium]|nr:acetyl-CoA C-acyltransferase [Actinomycetota bacterium]
MREAVIVSAVRVPVGKAPRGALRTVRPEILGVTALKGALAKVPSLDPAEIEDVIWGCAFPEAEQGLNLGRNLVLQAGLPDCVPGVTVNRFCSSGLQSVAYAAQAIICGWADVIVAGGTESMSKVPGGGNKPMFGMELQDASSDAYLSMGLTAEKVAGRYNISREEQDQFAVESHRRAVAAQQTGRFDDELVPVNFISRRPGPDGSVIEEQRVHAVDEGPRAGTTMEVLAGLRPVFKRNGTVTAGNSSQTSDGSGCVVLMSGERASKLGLQPLARFVSFAAGGVEPGVMGIGPTVAIPKALKTAGLKVGDIDLIELNEAFASQAVYVMRFLGLDPERTNVNGGAIALGHPLGATGAKLTATLLHEMSRRRGRYGIVSMCVAGGVGAAAIFERY